MEQKTLKSMKFGKEKLKNIWFFYKWYILAGILLLALGVTLVVRCATKKEADLYIYWSGPVYFSGDAQKEVSRAFEAVIPDEAAKTVGMITTVYGADVRYASLPGANEQAGYDYAGKTATLQEFKNQMRLPNTVICLLSPTCFEEAARDGDTLRPLAEVLDVLPDGATANGYGIRLSSLPFYDSNTVLHQFPEDTVLCLKNVSDFRSRVNYEKAVEAFKALAEFGGE